ncbi:MAG: peptidoglycan-binding domain-containing protein [Cyanobacteria bacterium P01_D01_bin.73]
METLAYPHMTLAHNPKSDPSLAIASVDLSAALSNLLPNWFRSLGAQPKLSSAGWVGFLALAIATSSWVVGAAAIAQTGTPGNSGLSFTDTSPNRVEVNDAGLSETGADDKASDDGGGSNLKPMPKFEINRDRPKSLVETANYLTMGFLGGDETVRRNNPRNSNSPSANFSTPRAASYGSAQYATAPRPAPSVSGSTLKYGMRSPQVSQLQGQLRLLGYFQGQSDGYFGNTTLASVRAFQRDRGLSVDGVVGTNTRSALYSGAGAGTARNRSTTAAGSAV